MACSKLSNKASCEVKTSTLRICGWLSGVTPMADMKLSVSEIFSARTR